MASCMYGYFMLLQYPQKMAKDTKMKHCGTQWMSVNQSVVNYAPSEYSLLEIQRRILAKYIIVKLIVIMIICGTSHSCVSCSVQALLYYFSCNNNYG